MLLISTNNIAAPTAEGGRGLVSRWRPLDVSFRAMFRGCLIWPNRRQVHPLPRLCDAFFTCMMHLFASKMPQNWDTHERFIWVQSGSIDRRWHVIVQVCQSIACIPIGVCASCDLRYSCSSIHYWTCSCMAYSYNFSQASPCTAHLPCQSLV